MPLNEETLKHINVTSGRGDGNIGLLKNGSKLNWPDALSGAEFKDGRDRISTLIGEALKQAVFNNKVDSGTSRELVKESDLMGRQLRKNVGDTDINDYIAAKGFIDDLNSAIVILKQNDVGSYVGGKYDLKARNVDELVRYMTEKGLTFAGLPFRGDEMPPTRRFIKQWPTTTTPCNCRLTSSNAVDLLASNRMGPSNSW